MTLPWPPEKHNRAGIVYQEIAKFSDCPAVLLQMVHLVHEYNRIDNAAQSRAMSRLKTEAISRHLKDDSMANLAKHLTVGFELETHKTNEANRENINQRTALYNQKLGIDEPSYKAAIRSRYKALSAQGVNISKIASMAKADDVFKELLYEEWVSTVDSADKAEMDKIAKPVFVETLSKRTPIELQSMLSTNGTRIKPSRLESLVDATELRQFKRSIYEDTKLQVVRSNYVVKGLNHTEFTRRKLLKCPEKHRELFDVGFDGSVRGFEIRTKGALTITEFIKAAEIAFDMNKHEIDIGCSFHLHVGLKGASHEYDPKMQSAMYEYLMEHINEVPATVLTRWDSLNNPPVSGERHVGQYFQPILKNTKFTFVNRHGQGTWEFRCFGNVTNKKDAMKCLMLAIKAIVYGHDICSGRKQPLVKNITEAQMKACIKDRAPLSTYLPKKKKESK